MGELNGELSRTCTPSPRRYKQMLREVFAVRLALGAGKTETGETQRAIFGTSAKHETGLVA